MPLLRERYETKIISYREGSAGHYTIMVNRIDAEGHEPLNRVGHIGEFYLFTKLDAKYDHSSYDARMFTNAFTAHDDDHLKRLLVHVEEGKWSLIEDGVTYTPDKIDEIIKG